MYNLNRRIICTSIYFFSYHELELFLKVMPLRRAYTPKGKHKETVSFEMTKISHSILHVPNRVRHVVMQLYSSI